MAYARDRPLGRLTVGRALQHSRYRMHCLAALLVTFTLVATWLLSGVAMGGILRFVAYEALYVLLPGCTLYLLLSRSPKGLPWVLAIGWPLGYAIELGAFALSAAAGARWAFTLLPLAATAAIGPRAYRGARARLGALRRGARPRKSAVTGRDTGFELAIVAVAVSIGLVVLALGSYAIYPLPEHVHSTYYAPDNLFQISLAAEARNHWPITTPYIAGQPLHYYTGVFMHVAAINQVTGVPLATVILRLLPSMMALLAALQLWLLGRSLGGPRLTGPLAVILFLVLDNLNLDPTRTEAFTGGVFNSLPGSPTYALGISFFLGLLLLMRSQFAGGESAARPSRNPLARSLPAGAVGSLAIVALLVLGASATKMFAAADLLAGLGVYWLWRVVTGKAELLLSLCLAVTLVCFGAVYRFVIVGGEESTLTIHPFAFVQATIFGQIFNVHTIFRIPLLIGAAGVALFCLCVPLLGVVWLLVRRTGASAFAAFAGSVFGASTAIYLILGDPGGPLTYFFYYGYIAAVPLSAFGLVNLWNVVPTVVRRRLALACGLTLALGLSVAASTRLLNALGILTGTSRDAWHVWYAAAYGLVGGAVVLAALWLMRDLAWSISSPATRALACCIPLIGVLGLVAPVAAVVPPLARTILQRPLGTPDSASHPGLTAALYRGLIWVRDHTSRCDVLAVNTHYLGGSVDSDYAYYSALTERRVFLEAWAETAAGVLGKQPFPARFALNSAATLRGSLTALRELARTGVSYVLIDKTHEGRAQEPTSASRLVFRNSALDVYRLMAPVGSDAASRTCGAVA